MAWPQTNCCCCCCFIPSRFRPVSVHLLHVGRASSHFLHHILHSISQVVQENADTTSKYVQVKHPFLTLEPPFQEQPGDRDTGRRNQARGVEL